MTLSLLGVGALLTASADLFTILKLAGAAYLIWLGIKLWRVGGRLDAEPKRDAASIAKMIGHAWIVTALNPKGITFFVAFVPQFIDTALPFLPQMLVFEATFLTLAFLNVLAYALVASRARHVFDSPRALSVLNKTGGTLLIGAGVATAAVSRT